MVNKDLPFLSINKQQFDDIKKLSSDRIFEILIEKSWATKTADQQIVRLNENLLDAFEEMKDAFGKTFRIILPILYSALPTKENGTISAPDFSGIVESVEVLFTELEEKKYIYKKKYVQNKISEINRHSDMELESVDENVAVTTYAILRYIYNRHSKKIGTILKKLIKNEISEKKKMKKNMPLASYLVDKKKITPEIANIALANQIASRHGDHSVKEHNLFTTRWKRAKKAVDERYANLMTILLCEKKKILPIGKQDGGPFKVVITDYQRLEQYKELMDECIEIWNNNERFYVGENDLEFYVVNAKCFDSYIKYLKEKLFNEIKPSASVKQN